MRIARVSYPGGLEKIVVETRFHDESALLTFAERDSKVWLQSALVSDSKDPNVIYYEHTYFVTRSGKVDPRAFSHQIVRRVNTVMMCKLPCDNLDKLSLTPDTQK
jgi:hypothetical protein